MKSLKIILTFLSFSCLVENVFSQAPGPYYFVSDDVNGAVQYYSDGEESYGGISMTKCINLLAHVLGDIPMATTGQTLVPVNRFTFPGGSTSLQPFAFTTPGSTRKINLPLGTNLQNFLNDPLGGGTPFDLTLPFNSMNIGLSDYSGSLRAPGGSIFHYAIDFDYNGSTTNTFAVVAPADGVIEGYSGGGSISIRHTASNGKEFLTYYQHLDPKAMCKNWNPGVVIKRGEQIGRIAQGRDTLGNPAYSHLHFGVAVRGPSSVINGDTIPEIWYEIDPFGVYDYRRNIFDNTTYNYFPANNLSVQAHGILHAYVFRTNPLLTGSLMLATGLDCNFPKPKKMVDLNSIGICSGKSGILNCRIPLEKWCTIAMGFGEGKGCSQCIGTGFCVDPIFSFNNPALTKVYLIEKTKEGKEKTVAVAKIVKRSFVLKFPETLVEKGAKRFIVVQHKEVKGALKVEISQFE